MFIGHFGAACGAKRLAPRASLGTLFLAAQFIDLLWPTLLLLGVERVTIAPGATEVTPLRFEHYPVSHSLVAVLCWAVLIGALHFLLQRRRRDALLLALLVISHWLLDFIVHQPDLPVFPGDDLRMGLGAWNSLPLTLLLEVPLFLGGVWLYSRCTLANDAQGRWGWRLLVGLLLIIYAANLFGNPPPDARAIAWVGEAQWLFVVWAFWIDRHRSARERT
jgi:hypothetical protein